LLRRQTARLLLLALLMQLILGLTQLPLIGLLIVLSVPGLTAGLLEAFHVTSRGGRPALGLLFTPLTSGRHAGRLFAMGALVFVIGVLCISLMLSGSEQLMDPALLERIEQGDIEAMTSLNQESLGRMVLAFMLGVGISGTLSYFTVPLIWFRDRKLGAALGTGLRALVVNWQPFLVLGLGLFLLFVPLAVMSGVLFTFVGAGGLISTLVMGGVMLLLLLFQMMLFGTQFCAFQDIFGLPDEPEAPAGDDGQLVA
jgi:hypothetical protein